MPVTSTTEYADRHPRQLPARRSSTYSASARSSSRPGIYKGRKPTLPIEEVRSRRHGEGKAPGAIAKALGVSRMSVWRVLKAA
jgi:DNA invertase Pin-like site-specific DNA recombinase